MEHLFQAIHFAGEVYQKISTMKLVGTMSADLVQRIQDIEKQLIKIQEDDLAAELKVEIENAHKKLEKCHQKCTEITDQNQAMLLISSESNKNVLENLQKELGHIWQGLNNAILLAMSKKMSDMKQERITMGSQPGLYPITNSNVSPPAAVDKPIAVITKNGKIEVKWNASPTSSVSHYEIKMNDSIERCFVNHCTVGSPVFRSRSPAGTYAIQVRAINAGGAGEWSDEVTVEYKKAPNKPKKPTLNPSYNNVQVDVIIPDIDESNGAAVNKIIVRYNLPTSPNNFQEQTFTIANMTSRYYSATISGLEPCMCYSFQIFLVNDCGRSIHSDPVFAYTMPRPRKPVNLKVFKCTYDSLTIIWDSPDDQQAAKLVEYYQLWYRKKNGNDHYQEYITAVNGIELNNLEPGTEYDFLVIAVNKNGHHSKEARITAKTKESMMYSLNLVATFLNSRFSF